MKTIGLIGGMSWESSIQYYRIINETVKARLGGLHSAKSVMVSVDFAEIEALQHAGRWDEAGRLMAAAAQSLERAGADCVVLCTNTMHKLADRIQVGLRIPFLHIADAAGERIAADGLTTVGLLGTRFTMEEEFYRERLERGHGLRVLVPGPAERAAVHRVIYDELCRGVIREESRGRYVEIIRGLVAAGAQGIVLGCTEIELLVRPADSPVPVFPTTTIHAVAAVDFALA
ncbi:MAG: aspartate/glutamate racemase family protein [candidate division NC10 bacterium]|nr:aspartate/glutamate racemase family protein [candidate division NC10 bacterium]